ncbi:hypothetical protein BC939DRAFT_505187 [Gamsiella multidivaricata]|uniref:uncharacterized protein n=1 Tax=Gamsiella multidivaricata TaxID=101098 RepID=UPI00221FE492|nr:uncharacterized protein BC939DRAFT_505187 [Gamsiella multidivaricata]KAI7820127.1 hypothetical protein BC939DRAFT_505187 [Gamsiella multidivaricata]
MRAATVGMTLVRDVDVDPLESVVTGLVRALHKAMSRTFTQGPATILYFDDPPTTQEAGARDAKALLYYHINSAVPSFYNFPEQCDNDPARTRRGKDVDVMNDQANKIQKMVDSNNTNTFSRTYKKAKRSWAAARINDSAHPGQTVGGSNDSGMPFHELKVLLRKDPLDHTITSYEVEDVIQKLEANEAQ